jgi:PKD repeat protein
MRLYKWIKYPQKCNEKLHFLLFYGNVKIYKFSLMRKIHIILLVISSLLLIFGLSSSDTFASCGGSWFSTSCPISPYCEGGKCGIDNGVKAVEQAVNGQITNKGIVEYAQQIIVYLMTFVSIIAVIYIIYAGFQLMIGAGDEEKMKKTRQIILYVVLGIIVMWLAYPIVKWTINIVSPGGRVVYDWSMIPGVQAYTESDADTFAEYKNKIKEWTTQMESELLINRSVKVSTIQNVKTLIQWGYDRLPDYGDAASINREAKQVVDTYLDLAIKNPDNSNHIGNAISRVANFMDRVNISRITGDISAGPAEGNAPLSVSFRADSIRDPSGTTPSDNNYIWWTRENGGVRRELSRGPSLSYTFTKEGTYTVFLDVISGSRNSKGKTDVLPLSVSKQILVKPKLGEIILLVNGVNVSNMSSLKLSPTVGKMGVILDASASRAIGNGTIAETKWEFGNGNDSTNRGGPIVERQLYTNQWGYILKLTMKTNDGQTISKEIQLLVREPAAIIKLDQETGNIGEDISMSATSYFADTRNVEYSWQIQDENGNKIVKIGEGISFKHKFETVGSYIVSLTAKSPNGSIDTDSKVITIESRQPVVTIDTPHPVNSEKPNTIVFDASKSYDPDTSSRKNLSYTWKIDGEKITLNNIENDGAKWTYTFDNKGNHNISVTVANTYGKITTVEKQFEVASTLAVNMIITPKVVQRGSPVTVIGQSANAEFFEWNMGDGTPVTSGTSRSMQHIYKQSGVYSIVMSVNREWGAETNTMNRKVYVSDTESPFAIIDASNSSNSIIEEKWACNGLDALVINRADTTTFSSNNSMNIDGTTNWLTYTWKYFGKARTTPQISEKFNELGCFPIELTVRSSKNGASHTTTQYVKLANHPPELTSLTSTVDAAKKDSQKILVKVQANWATDVDGVITSYIWYYTTESDPEPQNVQITQKNGITFVLPNITEKYFFGVILEDNDGAKMNTMNSWQSPTPLIIDNSNGNINLPLINLSVSKSTINVGEKILFSADVKTIIPGVNITNKSEYAWDWDGDGRIDEKSSTSSVEHIYTRSGNYNMKIRVTNNGVSNSKYQIIHVKNKLQAAAYAYRLPDNKIYLMNASEGSYDQARWEIGSTVSESPTSIVIDATGIPATGKLTISSNTSDTSTIDIDLSQLETISGTGILYQSYPRAVNDTITVKNPGDTVLLSMYGNTSTNYAIDTDTLIDTSLDGTPDNDTDNKNDASYTDGSPYVLHDLSSTNKRERKIALSLISSGSVVATRTITVILDYIASTSEADISLTGSTAGLSIGDRNKLEELSKLIRELTDSDRIILMQRYNTLIENWNNTFDKAKSLIDIQEGIESGTMNSEQKMKLSKVVDDLLVGDSQATDEIAIAVRLIRDLIPVESPNHDVLIAKLAAIESHPTLLTENKTLGKEMLVLIETDTSIPDKYKVHIKNQLSIIVNGGSASAIVANTTPSGAVVDIPATWGGVLGFISGFVKIFFIIIGIILIIGVIGFIFYRLSRKDDNIWFQDFLIDSVFHSRRVTPMTVDTSSTNVVVNGPPPLPKEDPLVNYTPIITPAPVIRSPAIDPLSIVTPLIVDTPVVITPITGDTVPDWLKAPSNIEKEIPQIQSDPISQSIDSISPLFELNTPEPVAITPTPTTTLSDDGIPDWIKNTPTTTETPPVNGILHVDNSTTAPSEHLTVVPPASEKLPDWLMNSLQSDTVSEVSTIENPIDNPIIPDTTEPTPVVTKAAPKKPKKSVAVKSDIQASADTGDIPSWLK